MKWFAWICLATLATGWAQTDGPVRSRVVLLERPAVVVDEFSVEPGGVRTLFVQALQLYTGEKNVGKAWTKLGIVPADIVGIKIYSPLGRVMGTRRALVDAVVETLGSAGVPPKNIIIWDKFNDDLEAAGWLPQPEGTLPVVRPVVSGLGFDGQQFYVNEILGKLIWGDFLFRGRKPTKEDLSKAAERVAQKFNKENPDTKNVNPADLEEQTSNKSYFAKIVTQTCTKLINIPVMADNGSFGLDGCLASLAMGSLDNTRRFQGEGIHGDPAIAEILDRDLFKKKVVLHIMDGLLAQYAGGPQFTPVYTQRLGALYLSRDPVAIDALILQRLEAWRAEKQIVPIGDKARHVRTAAEFGLGQMDPKLIDLVQPN